MTTNEQNIRFLWVCLQIGKHYIIGSKDKHMFTSIPCFTCPLIWTSVTDQTVSARQRPNGSCLRHSTRSGSGHQSQWAPNLALMTSVWLMACLRWKQITIANKYGVQWWSTAFTAADVTIKSWLNLRNTTNSASPNWEIKLTQCPSQQTLNTCFESDLDFFPFSLRYRLALYISVVAPYRRSHCFNRSIHCTRGRPQGGGGTAWKTLP